MGGTNDYGVVFGLTSRLETHVMTYHYLNWLKIPSSQYSIFTTKWSQILGFNAGIWAGH